VPKQVSLSKTAEKIVKTYLNRDLKTVVVNDSKSFGSC
jgi:hypothetical protein